MEAKMQRICRYLCVVLTLVLTCSGIPQLSANAYPEQKGYSWKTIHEKLKLCPGNYLACFTNEYQYDWFTREPKYRYGCPGEPQPCSIFPDERLQKTTVQTSTEIPELPAAPAQVGCAVTVSGHLIDDIDTDSDGLISLVEANIYSATKMLDLTVHDLATMQAFSDVVAMRIFGLENEKDFDFTLFSKLTELSLDISDTDTIPLNKMAHIQKLSISSKTINSLDMSQLLNVRELTIDTPQLQSLDISGLPHLQELNIWSSELQSLTTSNLPELQDLDIAAPKLQSLDISKLHSLKSFNFRNSKLNWHNYEPQHIQDQDRNQLSSLIASGLPKLELLDVRGSNLRELDIADNAKLHTLVLGANPLKSLRLSSLPALSEMYLWHTELASLNLNSFPNLIKVDAQNSKISALHVTKNTKLQELNLANNQLPTLTLSGARSLQKVDISNNKLSKVNISGLKKLQILIIHHNLLRSIFLNSLTSLEELDISYNKLHRMPNLTKAYALQGLLTQKNPKSQLKTVEDLSFKGKVKVGQILTAIPPKWNTSDVKVEYQWLVDGKKHSTAKKYRITNADIGRHIELRIIGKKTGWLSAFQKTYPGSRYGENHQRYTKLQPQVHDGIHTTGVYEPGFPTSIQAVPTQYRQGMVSQVMISVKSKYGIPTGTILVEGRHSNYCPLGGSKEVKLIAKHKGKVTVDVNYGLPESYGIRFVSSGRLSTAEKIFTFK